MSSPESTLLPRDTDFGYEVIEEKNKERVEVRPGDEGDDDTSSVSVADHYRGTPPLKGKKKKKPQKDHSRSNAVVSLIFCNKLISKDFLYNSDYFFLQKHTFFHRLENARFGNTKNLSMDHIIYQVKTCLRYMKPKFYYEKSHFRYLIFF